MGCFIDSLGGIVTLALAFSALDFSAAEECTMASRVVPATLLILAVAIIVATWGGSCLAQPAGLSPGDTYHLVFVTSSNIFISSNRTVPPAGATLFGGIPAADWVTQFHATVAAGSNPMGLSALHYSTGNPNGTAWDFLTPGPWQAVLSDSVDGNAKDRIPITAPVYNTNGDLVATGHTDMWDGNISAPIQYDEFGNVQSGEVWSGTSSSGVWSGTSCDDWDFPSNFSSGDFGVVGNVGGSWIFNNIKGCNQSARLYAISPELTVLQPGDVDSDLDVDGMDFLKWQVGTGTGPTNARLIDGDLDGDGNVDGDDFAVWESNYGLPLVANAETVPEPGGLMLLLGGVALVGGRCR